MTIHQRPDRTQPERYKDPSRHPSKQDMRRRDEYPILDPRRSRIEVNNLSTRGRHSPEYCYRDYDREHRHYEEDKKRQCEQKTSRSFDIHRERYEGDNVRRTFRSDDKNYECRHRRFDERGGKKFEDRERFYEDRRREDKGRGKRNVDHHLDRLSVASRDDDYRERLSERERDSGSVADGASTVSDRSNYLKFVKVSCTMVAFLKLCLSIVKVRSLQNIYKHRRASTTSPYCVPHQSRLYFVIIISARNSGTKGVDG